MIAQFKLSCIFLLETRVREAKADKVMRSIVRDWCYVYNLETGIGGRMCMFWDPRVLWVQVLSTSAQTIFGKASIVSSGKSFYFTSVYGSNDRETRKDMWRALIEMQGAVHGPWIVLGDFNTVFGPGEKVGGRPLSSDVYDFIADILLQVSLADLKWRGVKFTWSNCSAGLARIQCKLDRVLVNDLWVQEFSDSEAQFLPPLASDHSLGLVRVVRSAPVRRTFKFFNVWIKQPGFMEVVRAAWAQEVVSNRRGPPSPSFVVVQKLKAVKRVLSI